MVGGSLSPRLSAAVQALPLEPTSRVIEVGCGPGAAACVVAERVPDGHVLAVDRSATAVRQTARRGSDLVAQGRLDVRCCSIEDLELEPGEEAYDLAFANRVGALDGRHPELEAVALARLRAALRPGGLLYVDGHRCEL